MALDLLFPFKIPLSSDNLHVSPVHALFTYFDTAGVWRAEKAVWGLLTH